MWLVFPQVTFTKLCVIQLQIDLPQLYFLLMMGNMTWNISASANYSNDDGKYAPRSELNKSQFLSMCTEFSVSVAHMQPFLFLSSRTKAHSA